MPQGGAGGKKLGHLKKVFYCVFFTPSKDIMSVISRRLLLLEVKVNVTYISWLSDFALYLEDYLMAECHTWNNGSV